MPTKKQEEALQEKEEKKKTENAKTAKDKKQPSKKEKGKRLSTDKKSEELCSNVHFIFQLTFCILIISHNFVLPQNQLMIQRRLRGPRRRLLIRREKRKLLKSMQLH